MEPELDTFLTTVYCVVDELYATHFAPLKPTRRGAKPVLTDSEVLTLGLLAQSHRSRSERAFLASAERPLRPYFPHWPTQSTFNRRLRDLAGVLAHLVPLVAARTAALLGSSAYEVLDGVPVPLARRCRGQRHRCFGPEAAMGRGGSDKDWFFGQKLLLAVDAHGSITGAVSGPADTEEHWLADALFRWRRAPLAGPPTAAELDPVLGPAHRDAGHRTGPTGPILLRGAVGAPADAVALGDQGYRGQNWAGHWRRAIGGETMGRGCSPRRPTPRPSRRPAAG